MFIARIAPAASAAWLLAAVAISVVPAIARADPAPEVMCTPALADDSPVHGHMHAMGMYQMRHMDPMHHMHGMETSHRERAPGMHDMHGMGMPEMHWRGMRDMDPDGMGSEMGVSGGIHAGSCSSTDPVAPHPGMRASEVEPGASPVPALEDHWAYHGSPAEGVAGQAVPAAAAGDVLVDVTLTDALRIDPDQMSVPAGVPVTFVVTNAGALPHEFVVGDEAAQAAHGSAMLGMGSMTHDEPTAIGLQPGESKELTITFDEPGEMLAGCHVPGHYAAGMKATIVVTAPDQDQP